MRRNAAPLPRHRPGLLRAVGAAYRVTRKMRGEPGRQQRREHIARLQTLWSRMQRAQRTRRSTDKAAVSLDSVLAIQPFPCPRWIRWTLFLSQRPSTGRRRISAEEFYKDYSGIALRFKRGDDFRPGGEQPDLFKQLSALLAGSWSLLTGVIACGLMLTLLMLIIPASLGVFVDDFMEKHGSWGGLVTALLGGGVLVYVLSLLKHRFLSGSLSGYR